MIRRSVTISAEMRVRLEQLTAERPYGTSQSDVIREALRAYIDEQSEVVSSRKHFQKSFQDRLDKLEFAISFQLNVLIYLLAEAISDQTASALENAIIAAKRDGETLLLQIAAVRDMRIDDE